MSVPENMDVELRLTLAEIEAAELGGCRIAAHGLTIRGALNLAIGDPRLGYQRSVLTVARNILEQNAPRG